MYQVTQLESGLRVATAELPYLRSVSLGLWVGIGSRYEPAHSNGVCHFIEHLLFKGTRRRSAREISQAVEGVGGYLNAFTSEESTCFHARACSDRLEELLDVLLDMMLHSRFAPADVHKEREVIKEEMAMYLDDPQHQVQELLNATVWPDHPLGRPITGTDATLDRLARRQLLQYLGRNYLTSNMLLVAAGNVRHRQLLRALARQRPNFNPGPRPRFLPAQSTQSAPRAGLVTKTTEQTQLALAIRTCSRHDPRRYPLRLLNTILGENMSSRLFQVLREDRGLAYSIYSTLSFFHDAGDLVISAGLETDKVPQALRLITSELRRLRQSLPGAAELRRARGFVLGQIELGQESADHQMNWVGEHLLGYEHILSPSAVKRRLASVSAAEIRAAARDFLRPERLNLALVSPLKSTRGFNSILASVCAR
jgi:predicted Zn-dependent peptidase